MENDKQWLLDALDSRTAACTRCTLHSTRTNVVVGRGPSISPLYVIGEAPGRAEDLSGTPFVGDSGKLLTNGLEAVGVCLSKIHICNTLKCRPPNNRDPEPLETHSCQDWLYNKLIISKPSLVIAVGRFATAWIMDEDVKRIKIVKLTNSRVILKREFSDFAVAVVPVLHPAYIKRTGKQGDFIGQLARAAAAAEKMSLNVFE